MTKDADTVTNDQQQLTPDATVSELAPRTINHYAALAADTAAFQELVRSNGGVQQNDLDRITVPPGGGSVWCAPGLNGNEYVPHLEGIIVAWRDTRAYWEHSFEDGGGGAPPDCVSQDAITGSGRPGGECAVCPKADWGTAPDGRGQACRLVRELLLLREHDQLPVIVSVPPSSHGEIRKFFTRLSGQGLPYCGAIVQLGLEPVRSRGGITYSCIKPKLLARLAEDDIGRLRALGQTLSQRSKAA